MLERFLAIAADQGAALDRRAEGAARQGRDRLLAATGRSPASPRPTWSSGSRPWSAAARRFSVTVSGRVSKLFNYAVKAQLRPDNPASVDRKPR